MGATQFPPQAGTGGTDGVGAAKVALRDQLLTTRRRRSLLEVGEAARSLAAVLLATGEVRRAATVAAYVSVGSEPGTGPLLAALLDAGHRVVVPVLAADLDLAWARYRGPAALAPAGRGMLEPVGERLPPEAVATADVVLVPGLAVDTTGLRLGRGGGSYDRALARVPASTFSCVLLHDEEVLPVGTVPGEPHDRRVAAVATPAGLTRF